LQIFCIDIKPRERRERGKEREKEEFFEEGERAEWKQGDTHQQAGTIMLTF
jgi:hypothetical protein